MPKIGNPANASRNASEKTRQQKIQKTIDAIGVFLRKEHLGKQGILDEALKVLEQNAQVMEKEREIRSLLEVSNHDLQMRLLKTEEELVTLKSMLSSAHQQIQVAQQSVFSDFLPVIPQQEQLETDFNAPLPLYEDLEQQMHAVPQLELAFPPLFEDVPGIEGTENVKPPSNSVSSGEEGQFSMLQAERQLQNNDVQDVESVAPEVIVSQSLEASDPNSSSTPQATVDEPTSSADDSFGDFIIPEGMNMEMDIEELHIDLLQGDDEGLLDQLEAEDRAFQAEVEQVNPPPASSNADYGYAELLNDGDYS